MVNKYKPVIGLEVHIELSTQSKMFCSCPADHFAKKPNTQVCPICLGLPGALPFPNKSAIDYTIKLGHALNCKINKFSKFDRKHYFYPDLPKSFQISQYDLPFCTDGVWQREGLEIEITRVHLEEDTGKLVHEIVDGKRVTLVDFNRSGVPLLEMVTGPDFTYTNDVISFLKEIQLIVRYLEISSADMEKGSMRLEANVSISRDGKLPDYKVELKNINSFRFLEKAIESELERQEKVLARGGKVSQETRGYDEVKGITFLQRSKEEAQDYRYFPEPDIPPLTFSDKRIKELEKQIGALPADKRSLYERKFELPTNYIEIFVQNKGKGEYFEKAVKLGEKHGIAPDMIAASMVNNKLDEKYNQPAGLVRKLVELTKKSYASRDEVEKVVVRIIKEEESAVADYQKGKSQTIGFLIGKSQELLKGKGNPKQIKKVLEEILKQESSKNG